MAAIFAQHPSAEPGSNNDIHCGILLILTIDKTSRGCVEVGWALYGGGYCNILHTLAPHPSDQGLAYLAVAAKSNIYRFGCL